jgi:hypothetical protein
MSALLRVSSVLGLRCGGRNNLPLVRRLLSDSITYSGGQASEGQGGFYGSGGSRLVKSKPAHHPEALARQVDVSKLSSIWAEVETLETELQSLGSSPSSRSIEIKARIKKTISNPSVRELLQRLEIKGEPVWGLSSSERDLVRAVKSKYLSS